MHSLTTGEVAAYCGVNLRTAIRWIDKGHLPAYKLPGRGNNRIRLVDFLNFVDRHGIPLPQALTCYSNRVLIVDDDARMACSIARTLGAAGFETRTALDGFQAGDALRSFLPAAMTLDLKMPGLDGFQVLEYVRGEPELSRLKILVISSLPQARLREAVASGANDALAKPFEAAELVHLLKALLPERVAVGLGRPGRESVSEGTRNGVGDDA